MVEDSDKLKKTKRDIDDYFLQKIASHLETISELQYTIRLQPAKIFYLNLELHEIFKMIIPFLQENNQKKDIEIQWKYENFLLRLNPIAQDRKPDDSSGEIERFMRVTKDYTKYKILCDKRQIHIYECMTKVGIIGRLKVDAKRIR